MTTIAKLEVTTPEKFAVGESERMKRTSLEGAIARVEGMLAVDHFFGPDSPSNHYFFPMGLPSRETLVELKKLYEEAGWRAGFSYQGAEGRESTFMLWLHP